VFTHVFDTAACRDPAGASRNRSTDVGRKQGYIDKSIEFTVNNKGKPALRAVPGSHLSNIWPGGLNITCHGCHNQQVPPATEGEAEARAAANSILNISTSMWLNAIACAGHMKPGFLACCNKATCKPKGGKQSGKTWCETCLKAIDAEDWRNAWVVRNDDNPHESEQNPQWYCPHCCAPLGHCPARQGCSSISAKEPRTDGTQAVAGNTHHGLPLQPAGSRLTDKQAQYDAAEEQYRLGQVGVCRLSNNAIALPAYMGCQAVQGQGGTGAAWDVAQPACGSRQPDTSRSPSVSWPYRQHHLPTTRPVRAYPPGAEVRPAPEPPAHEATSQVLQSNMSLVSSRMTHMLLSRSLVCCLCSGLWIMLLARMLIQQIAQWHCATIACTVGVHA